MQLLGAEKIVWVKNDRLLPPSPYFQYVHDPGLEIYKLVIKDSFPEDSGVYVCEAYNQAGGTITFASVTVTGSIPSPTSTFLVRPQSQSPVSLVLSFEFSRRGSSSWSQMREGPTSSEVQGTNGDVRETP